MPSLASALGRIIVKNASRRLASPATPAWTMSLTVYIAWGAHFNSVEATSLAALVAKESDGCEDAIADDATSVEVGMGIEESIAYRASEGPHSRIL